MCPRRPPYVNDCAIRISQAKVETPVIRGKIASSGSGESGLSIYTNSRAKSVTAAARAAKGNCQPVSLAPPIHQHNGMSPVNGQHCVHPTGIVQITAWHAPAPDLDGKS